MIVVGWNDADGGRDALELAGLLEPCLGVDVMLVSVIVTGASPHERERLTHDGGRVAVAPSVAQGLNDVAAEVDATALVVGSSQRGRLGHTVLGTGVEQLAAAARCPLAVAPRGYAQRYAVRLARVETSFDGSAASERALELAGRIAGCDRGSVRVHARPELRQAVERCLAGLPRDVIYEVDTQSVDRSDDPAGGLARRAADMVIAAGRSTARARHVPSAALMIV